MSEPEKKKRLPVLQDRVDDEIQPEDRPAFQWLLASAVVTLIMWLILAGTVMVVAQRVAPESVLALQLAHVVALASAAAVAGGTAARLGKKAQRKHATRGAMLAASFGWLYSTLSTPQVPIAITIVLLGMLLLISWVGAYAGYRAMSRPR